MERVDAVVIGAGLNGLTAAARLGGAGLSVLIVERTGHVGGGAAHDVLAPGYSAPPIGFSHSYIPPELIREFDLAREGLQLIRREGGISLFDEGIHVANYANANVMRRELARHSRQDADAWPRFVRDMKRQAELIRQSLLKAQEDPGEWSIAAFKQMMSRTKSVMQMEPEALYDLTRYWALSLDDFLAGYFENPHIRAHFAAPALIGRALGPSDPTGASLLPAQWMTGDNGGAPWRMSPKGGTQALADCLLKIVRKRGGDIRFNAEVTDIKMVDKKAAGVVLADGEEIDAGIVLSDLDIKRSFLSLFQWSGLPDGFARDVANVRMEGIVARINFALEGLPEITGISKDNPALSGGLIIGGGLEPMDRAYEDWLDERPPTAPLLEIAIPTLDDPSLAPKGGHVFAVSAQYVPTELHDGVWSTARRDTFMQTVRDMIARHAPGFEKHIVAEELRLPSDIEDQAGYTRGDPFLGQMSLDQMFFNRPVPGFSGHESPIKNFYVCSASGHPAGLALGAAGANVAQGILGSLKGRRQ